MRSEVEGDTFWANYKFDTEWNGLSDESDYRVPPAQATYERGLGGVIVC